MELNLLQKQAAAIDAAIKLKELGVEYTTLCNRMKELQSILENNCQHTDIEVKRTYFSGSYYDKSSVTISHKCTLCKKTLKEYDDPNHHGSYG
jgi:hypothetical protein